jgi:hypothetical protein
MASNRNAQQLPGTVRKALGVQTLTEGYQVRPAGGRTVTNGYQSPAVQVKPTAPSTGSGVKPPPTSNR